MSSFSFAFHPCSQVLQTTKISRPGEECFFAPVILCLFCKSSKRPICLFWRTDRDVATTFSRSGTADPKMTHSGFDGSRRWGSQDGKDNCYPLKLTGTRIQQHWSTPINTNFNPSTSNQSSNYTMTDPSFTQQLNGIDTSPESDNSSLQAWPSGMQTFTSQATSYRGIFSSASYSANTAWPSMGASITNPYTSNQAPDNFMASNFPKFEPIGAGESSLHYVNKNTDPSTDLPNQKSLEDTIGLNFDTDFNAFESDGTGSDEHNTIINLSQVLPTSLDDPINLQATSYQRRQSSASFVSSAGPMNDPPDASSYPEALTYTSDYTPQSSLNMSSTPLSPVPSPRCTPQETVRTSSRSRASQSPHPSIRSTPYSFDAARNNRASTSSFTSSPAKRSSPYSYSANEGYFQQVPVQSQVTTHSMVNTLLPSSNTNSAMQYAAFGGIPRFHQPTMPPSTFDPASRIETVPYMLSNGTFRTLQSNAGPGGHVHDHFCDHADPPDLFGPLSEEQLVPPLDDMKPDDAELTPHEQELRFEGDLYTPRFVRGHGNKREGWCGICKPGRWLVLKNSAYWYDKSFTHGISAASGQAFEGPRETRRMDGNADVWEGLCGSCGEWIALVSSKKKGTTWFRHAYKVCQRSC